jgi:hypothetical protein
LRHEPVSGQHTIFPVRTKRLKEFFMKRCIYFMRHARHCRDLIRQPVQFVFLTLYLDRRNSIPANGQHVDAIAETHGIDFMDYTASGYQYPQPFDHGNAYLCLISAAIRWHISAPRRTAGQRGA